MHQALLAIRSELLINGKALETNLQKSEKWGVGGGGQCPPLSKSGGAKSGGATTPFFYTYGKGIHSTVAGKVSNAKTTPISSTTRNFLVF